MPTTLEWYVHKTKEPYTREFSVATGPSAPVPGTPNDACLYADNGQYMSCFEAKFDEEGHLARLIYWVVAADKTTPYLVWHANSGDGPVNVTFMTDIFTCDEAEECAGIVSSSSSSSGCWACPQGSFYCQFDEEGHLCAVQICDGVAGTVNLKEGETPTKVLGDCGFQWYIHDPSRQGAEETVSGSVAVRPGIPYAAGAPPLLASIIGCYTPASESSDSSAGSSGCLAVSPTALSLIAKKFDMQWDEEGHLAWVTQIDGYNCTCNPPTCCGIGRKLVAVLTWQGGDCDCDSFEVCLQGTKGLAGDGCTEIETWTGCAVYSCNTPASGSSSGESTFQFSIQLDCDGTGALTVSWGIKAISSGECTFDVTPLNNCNSVVSADIVESCCDPVWLDFGWVTASGAADECALGQCYQDATNDRWRLIIMEVSCDWSSSSCCPDEEATG